MRNCIYIQNSMDEVVKRAKLEAINELKGRLESRIIGEGWLKIVNDVESEIEGGGNSKEVAGAISRLAELLSDGRGNITPSEVLENITSRSISRVHSKEIALHFYKS